MPICALPFCWTAAGTWTSSQVRRLEPEQTYHLQLRALNVYSSSEPIDLTVTTGSMPHVDPPADLEVTGVEWNGVDLTWQASSSVDIWRYEILNPDSGSIVGIGSADTLTAHIKLQPERTYRFAVRAAKVPIIGQQVHSELTHEITITTPEQFVAPPTELQADRDGNDVTLTWQRPAGETGNVEYLVYDGDELETIITGQNGPIATQTITRQSSGTHDFTVRMRYPFPTQNGHGVSAPTNPAAVTVPLSDDAVPPTPPTTLRVLHDCDTNADWYELEGATDDVSPLGKITYEGLLPDTRTGTPWYVVANRYNIPGTGSWPAQIASPVGLRAVDETGNRSEIVRLHIFMELVNC